MNQRDEEIVKAMRRSMAFTAKLVAERDGVVPTETDDLSKRARRHIDRLIVLIDSVEVFFTDGTKELFRAWSRHFAREARLTCKGAITRHLRKHAKSIDRVEAIAHRTEQRTPLARITDAQLLDMGIVTAAPPMSTSARAKIKSIFTKVLDGVREQAERNMREHYTAILDRCKNEIGQITGRANTSDRQADPFFKVWPSHDPNAARYGALSNTGTLAMRFYRGCSAYDLHRDDGGSKWPITGYVPDEIQHCNYFHIMRAPEEIAAMIDTWVLRDMAAMFDGFIAKQTEKLTPIIGGRDVEVTGEVSGSLEGRFHFKVGDKAAAFTMQTQIVWKYLSAYGTHFWQFPTTFHAATNDLGEKISKPSHAKLVREL